MACIKSVIRTFLPLGKTAYATESAQGMETIPSGCDELMGIGLMAHIPYDLIFWGIKHIMDGDG